MNKLVIGTIAWGEGNGASTTVFVGETAEQVRRAAVEHLAQTIADGDLEDIEEWAAENPTPNLDDASAVRAWLASLWEFTDEAMFDVYERDGGASSGCLVYHDVR